MSNRPQLCTDIPMALKMTIAAGVALLTSGVIYALIAGAGYLAQYVAMSWRAIR